MSRPQTALPVQASATPEEPEPKYVKEALALVATNLHILVLSLLITGLDMGIVRTGTTEGSQQKHPAINLSTGSAPHSTPSTPSAPNAPGGATHSAPSRPPPEPLSASSTLPHTDGWSPHGTQSRLH